MRCAARISALRPKVVLVRGSVATAVQVRTRAVWLKERMHYATLRYVKATSCKTITRNIFRDNNLQHVARHLPATCCVTMTCNMFQEIYVQHRVSSKQYCVKCRALVTQ